MHYPPTCICMCEVQYSACLLSMLISVPLGVLLEFKFGSLSVLIFVCLSAEGVFVCPCVWPYVCWSMYIDTFIWWSMSAWMAFAVLLRLYMEMCPYVSVCLTATLNSEMVFLKPLRPPKLYQHWGMCNYSYKVRTLCCFDSVNLAHIF